MKLLFLVFGVLYWCGHRPDRIPSASDSVGKNELRNSIFFGHVGDHHPLPIIFNPYIPSGISILIGPCCPSHVKSLPGKGASVAFSAGIISVVVDAVECKTFGPSGPHSLLEEVELPESSANCDTPASIIRILPEGCVAAPRYHARPRGVHWGFLAADTRAVTSGSSANLSLEASTGFDRLITQVGSIYDLNGSAVTLAIPMGHPILHAKKGNNFEPVKLFASKILDSWALWGNIGISLHIEVTVRLRLGPVLGGNRDGSVLFTTKGGAVNA